MSFAIIMPIIADFAYLTFLIWAHTPNLLTSAGYQGACRICTDCRFHRYPI